MYRIIRKLNRMGNSFKLFEISILRMIVGGYILYKGLTFADQREPFLTLLDGFNADNADFFIMHYVLFSHIVGGLLLLFGLLTRIASIVQIPILIGAVIINFTVGDPPQFLASILILLCLIFITIFGSGKGSVDYKLKMHM